MRSEKSGSRKGKGRDGLDALFYIHIVDCLSANRKGFRLKDPWYERTRSEERNAEGSRLLVRARGHLMCSATTNGWVVHWWVMQMKGTVHVCTAAQPCLLTHCIPVSAEAAGISATVLKHSRLDPDLAAG